MQSFLSPLSPRSAASGALVCVYVRRCPCAAHIETLMIKTRGTNVRCARARARLLDLGCDRGERNHVSLLTRCPHVRKHISLHSLTLYSLSVGLIGHEHIDVVALSGRKSAWAMCTEVRVRTR